MKISHSISLIALAVLTQACSQQAESFKTIDENANLKSSSSSKSLSITSPTSESAIQKNTKITGNCNRSHGDVYIAGPGIDKGKKISCQDNSKYEYSLVNAFKKMADGKITITISQKGGQKLQRLFIKGELSSVTPDPITEPAPTQCADGHKLNELFFNSTSSEVRDCDDQSMCNNSTPQKCEYKIERQQKCELVNNQAVVSALDVYRKIQLLNKIECPTVTQQPNSFDLDPKSKPAMNFDLRLWKLTLPIDSAGSFNGRAMEVKTISQNYEKLPYFYTASDGAMVFSAPTTGATTSGSKYPRSELRELTSSGAEVAWTVEQGGFLAATLAVNEVPTTSAGAKGRVIVGQIHGPADELCRLYYDNGKIYFHDDKSGNKIQELEYVLKSSTGEVTHIGINEKFEYEIEVANKALTVRVRHNGVVYSAVDPISSFWPGKSLYYKAGVYVQVGKASSGSGTIGTGVGRVSFYELLPPLHGK